MTRLGLFGWAIYSVVAFGSPSAHGTPIGQMSEHGSELRELCSRQAMFGLCTGVIDGMANDVIEQNGYTSTWWDVPTGTEIETLEQATIKYLRYMHDPKVDAADGHVAVALAIGCRFPSSRLKALIAKNDKLARECASTH